MSLVVAGAVTLSVRLMEGDSRFATLRFEVTDTGRGMTEAEIVAALEDKHGDEITNPRQPWYTFFVPFLPFLCLGLLIFWVVSRWRRVDESAFVDATVDDEPGDDDRLERLRAQVRSHED